MERRSKTEPYVGPRPFERSDESLFFGRDRETLELLSLIVANRVVVLYAASGAGKSSLINASLIPQLEVEDFEVLAVARVRHLAVDERLPEQVSNAYVFGTLSHWGDEGGSAAVPVDATIAGFLEGREHNRTPEGDPAPRAIVVDQVEELFTLYPDRWRDREGFFRQLAQALEADALLRLVLSIREDYVAELDRYAPLLPNRLRTRLRLERLNPEAALAAVTRPLEGRPRSFAPGVAEELVQELLRVRADVGGGETIDVEGEYVEPVQLQVVCQQLWSRLPEDVTEITAEHVRAFGDVDQVLAQLYEESLHAAAAKSSVNERRLRKWVEDALVTVGGTRGTVYQGPERTEGMPNDVVRLLEDKRLLRGEWRAGARWYELTHDRLIGPIRQSNARYAARRSRRARRRLALAAGAAVLVAAGVLSAVLLSTSESAASKTSHGTITTVVSVPTTILHTTTVNGRVQTTILTTTVVTTVATRVVTYRLTVKVSGPGAVSSSTGGLSCPGSCAASFASGKTVTLTAKAGRGSVFEGWGGQCAGSDAFCTLIVDANSSVTASFVPPVQ